MSDPFEAIMPFDPPGHLFLKEVTNVLQGGKSIKEHVSIKPVNNPTIRIRVKSDAHFNPDQSDDEMEPGTWRHVSLYEFHPDYDNRMKARGRAYVEPQPDLVPSMNYQIIGSDYLAREDQYMEVREFSIHEKDRNAMQRWCIHYNTYEPLILKPCRLPFPMFKKGDRVNVVSESDHLLSETLGKSATVTEESSGGGMTMICFDDAVLNRGIDGVSLFKAIAVPSICLRRESMDLIAHARMVDTNK